MVNKNPKKSMNPKRKYGHLCLEGGEGTSKDNQNLSSIIVPTIEVHKIF